MQDLTAIQTANLLNINRNTINGYYQIYREKILAVCEEENGYEGELVMRVTLAGNIIMGKSRGSENKIPFFGIFKNQFFLCKPQVLFVLIKSVFNLRIL